MVLRDEVMGEERILHNDKLHGFCSSPHTVWVMKSSRMRGEGHLECKWKYKIRMDLQKVGWARRLD